MTNSLTSSVTGSSNFLAVVAEVEAELQLARARLGVGGDAQRDPERTALLRADQRFRFGIERVGNEARQVTGAVEFRRLGAGREMGHRHEADEAGLAFQVVGAFDGAVDSQCVRPIIAHARLKGNRAVARGKQFKLGRAWLGLRKDPRERRIEPEKHSRLLLIAEGDMDARRQRPAHD